MVPYRRFQAAAGPDADSDDEDHILHVVGHYQPAQLQLMALPIEIIVWIFEIYCHTYRIRSKHLTLSKLLYAALVPLVYHHPVLKATNFYGFVDAITKKRHLGRQVKQLDMSTVVQLGKNAFVAKLLKRLAPSLETFVAPCTSFGFGPLLALKNCLNLKILDLSLVLEMLDLGELFRLVSRLQHLTHLAFPRSLVEITDYETICWPPRLAHLHISGGVTDDFLIKLTFPLTITTLEFSNCPQIHDSGFHDILLKVGRNLTCFRIQYPMPNLSLGALDVVFNYAPFLKELEVLVEYVLGTFFDEDNLVPDPQRPLRVLYLGSLGSLGTTTKLDPIDLAIALDDGRLPNLKHVITLARLGWGENTESVAYIADDLDQKGGGLRMVH